jgi:F-type H+-transporting ATPase subunit a
MIFLLTETARHEASHAHPEAANWVKLLAKSLGHSPVSEFLLRWETAIYSALVVGLISLFAFTVARRARLVPGRLQTALEMLVSGLEGLVTGVLGPEGRRYTPFVGSLFIYILFSNLFGLVPLQNSTMAFLTTTAPLAICVFLYVQWIGITQNGPIGYLYHMCGSPKDVFGWILVPLNFPLHVLGEFIKPLSLSFRLYGNIMAGHILLAVFLGLGVGLLAPLHVPAGVPLHFPFLFLEIMVGAIQAFVFTLLSTVYIAMMLPHGEHEHGDAPAH